MDKFEFNFLMNLALSSRDFEWAKELQREKNMKNIKIEKETIGTTTLVDLAINTNDVKFLQKLYLNELFNWELEIVQAFIKGKTIIATLCGRSLEINHKKLIFGFSKIETKFIKYGMVRML